MCLGVSQDSFAVWGSHFSLHHLATLAGPAARHPRRLARAVSIAAEPCLLAARADDPAAFDVDVAWQHGAASSLVTGGRCDGRVAFVARGALPLYQLALVAQERGAVAVVIYDSPAGRCEAAYDQRCVPGGSQHRREGFAAQDMPALWYAPLTPAHRLVCSPSRLRRCVAVGTTSPSPS